MAQAPRAATDGVAESPIEISPLDEGFRQFGVSPKVAEALALREIHRTFPIQALVLEDAIAGRDVLAMSRTGSGKTLAFAIPIVERTDSRKRRPSALVLVPTRELATQVAEEFRGIAEAKGLRVATVYGGIRLGPQAQHAARSHVVIATPGRLLDLVRRKMLRVDEVRICVLDEADRMLDMGFLPDVGRILSMLPKERQTMLFGATLDGEVGELASQYTKNPFMHRIVEERPVIAAASHRFIKVNSNEKLPMLVRELATERGLTLVFVRTKRAADRIAGLLKAQGFSAQALHGDMSQPARERTLARFETGKADVLVATDVAARGLDLEHITHVANFDPPEDEKAYVHRAGRTARAGRGGDVVTFVAPDQVSHVAAFASRLDLQEQLAAAQISRASPRRVYRSRKAGRGRTGRRRR